MIFLMHVAAIEQLDFTEQESEKHNLQLLIFLTHQTPSTGLRHPSFNHCRI